MTRLEHIILRHLIYTKDYANKVLPFIKDEYFLERIERTLFRVIVSFLDTYHANPTYEALVLSVSNQTNLREEEVTEVLDLLKVLYEHRDDETNLDWLTQQTELFCQDKAVYNAVLESVAILENKKDKRSKGEIPELLKTALGVSFDSHVGHDYLEQASDRYEFYHRKEDRIPFDLEYFNKITNGGLPKKTLNIFMAGCVHPDTKIRIRFRKKE